MTSLAFQLNVPNLPKNISFSGLSKSELALFKLHEKEEQLLPKQVSAVRKSQFTLGRAVANRALAQLGFSPPPPLLSGPNREPLWPENIVGSISHSHGFAVSVAAFKSNYRALGIDLERIKSARRYDIAPRICTEHELEWVNGSSTDREVRLTSLFSAKESLFKAIFPLFQQYFWYRDVTLAWDNSSNSFKTTSQLPSNLPRMVTDALPIEVKLYLDAEYVLTMCAF